METFKKLPLDDKCMFFICSCKDDVLYEVHANSDHWMIAGRKRGHVCLSTKQGFFKMLICFLWFLTFNLYFKCFCTFICTLLYSCLFCTPTGSRITIAVLCLPLVAGYVRPPQLGLPNVDKANICCNPPSPHLVCVFPPALSSSFCISA